MPRTGLIATIIAAFGLMAGTVSAHDTPVAEFFYKVAVGPVASLAEALEHEPELALTADAHGFTAVHVLDYLGFSEKLALLQRFGADINARNYEGRAMLHMIIDPTLIPAAVAAGADVDLRDHKGRTPLTVHLLEPDGADFVPALLAAGADVNARDAKGVSVLEYAAPFDDLALTRTLTDAGAIQ